METGTKILVVDDNDFIRIGVSKMLSRLGYEVASADCGENGLSILLKVAPTFSPNRTFSLFPKSSEGLKIFTCSNPVPETACSISLSEAIPVEIINLRPHSAARINKRELLRSQEAILI